MARKKNEHTERDAPAYHEESFKQKKPNELIKYILSREGWIVEIEGGKRGGKDVYGIYAWSQYLMVTPDKEHLVLGKTLEHAIVTVLKSQGFGLYYCIPSGEFTRESISGGATRGVFKFKDAYDVEKIVYFYGNEKREDNTKFKGFTLGSVYINEGNEQHINGIREAKERTNAGKWPRIIITQNPKSASHVFYRDFEAPLLYTEEENLLIESVKSRFLEQFEEDKKDMLAQMEKEKKQKVRSFLSARGVKTADQLPAKERRKLLAQVRDLKEMWAKKIRGLQVKHYTDDYADPDNKSFNKIHSASFQLLVNYRERYENPNDVPNGLEFAYFHFTHDDNLSMSDADRSRVDRTYDKKSPSYKRDIRGERATVDNAIFPTFNEDNIYDYDLNYKEMTRVLGVDVGYDHPFGALDGYIDKNNVLWIDNELFIIPADEKEKANNVEYIKRLKELINSQCDGAYSRVRVDPSAKGFINQCTSSGVLAMKAKNKVRNHKPEEVSESDRTNDKKIVGINLVREGFRLKGIMIRKRCVNLIKEIQGYSFDDKKLELGIETPLKINDDLVDPLRYIVNSEIGYVAKWERGVEIDVEEGQKRVLEQTVREEDQRQQQGKLVEQILREFKKGNGNNTNSGYLF